jgi:hypothetical protein
LEKALTCINKDKIIFEYSKEAEWIYPVQQEINLNVVIDEKKEKNIPDEE